MAKKIVWLLVSCLMVLSLLIASCDTPDTSGTVTTEDKGQTVVVGEEEEEMAQPGKPSVTVDPDKPVYGGRLTILVSTAPATWNPGSAAGRSAEQASLVLEQILGIDRERMEAGTGEISYIGGVPDYTAIGPNLAESWETPEVGVWVLNIRRGVHFGYHPGFPASELVKGREMTAEDVAYSIEYMRDNKTSATQFSEPGLINATTVERTGPWQITVKTPVAPTTGYLWIMGGGGVQYVWPKEFLEQYATSNDWRDTVGTGPYLTDDYVLDSSVKYIRNDNYWDVNPVGPGQGDQLPYISTINWQIIPDESTRMAAFRTGKADWSYSDTLTVENYEMMMKTNPEMESVQIISAPLQISGRIDIPEDPYSNILVRKAMMLAIDHPTVVRDLYDGKAELLDSPVRKWYPAIYTPLEEFSEDIQELYGYNLEKAKQLMIDAGYPDGFKTKLIMINNTASEEASALLKNYLADINIELELTPIEPSIFFGMFWQHKTTDWVLNGFAGGDGSFFARYSMGYYRGPNAFNVSHVDDPVGTDPIIEQAYNDQCKYVMVNYPEADRVTKEAYKYCIEQVFNIPMPAPWAYRIWQPWLKNYYGEYDPKFWLRWAWIDQDLKAEILNK
jgi:peptide/nickel transport system substrate-binding protein